MKYFSVGKDYAYIGKMKVRAVTNLLIVISSSYFI